MKGSWLFVVLALGACGEVLETPLDGPADDGGGDAPPDVAVRGPVTVTVLDRTGSGAVAIGVPVAFVDPDGTIVAVEATDGQGKATAEILPGGSATAVVTIGNGKNATTILAIAPGDDVVIGRTNPDQGTAGTFVVNWTQLGGANEYVIFGPCGFQGSAAAGVTTRTITLRNDCNPATMELLIQARNTSNATIGFSSKANIAVAAGSTTMGPFNNSLGFTGSFTNISRTTNLTMTRRAPDGLGFSDSITKDVSALTETTASATVPSTGSARVDTTLSGTQNDSQEIHQRLAGNASTYGLDVAAVALPWINAPSLDVATRTITITADATGTSGDVPDLVQTSLSWRRGGATSYSWVIFGPSLESITLPALTGDLADALPTVGDAATGNRVVAYDADTFAGYAAVREATGAAIVGTFDDSPRGTAGLVRISTSVPGN